MELLSFLLTGGEVFDSKVAIDLLKTVDLTDKKVLADRRKEQVTFEIIFVKMLLFPVFLIKMIHKSNIPLMKKYTSIGI